MEGIRYLHLFVFFTVTTFAVEAEECVDLSQYIKCDSFRREGLCKSDDKVRFKCKFTCGLCASKPECSNHTDCHSEAVCDNNKCQCREGFNGDGIKNCEPTCLCVGTANAFYRTYDGNIIRLGRRCEYLLTDSTIDAECGFRISIRHKWSSNYGFYLSWLVIRFGGKTFRFASTTRADVDGVIVPVFPPFRRYGIEMRNSGEFIVFRSIGCGITVKKSRQQVFIETSQKYKGNMTGICGQCDGNTENDYTTKNGEDVSKNLKDRDSIISESYTIDSTLGECNASLIMPCHPAKLRMAQKRCGMHNVTGPFGTCIKSHKLPENIWKMLSDSCAFVDCTASTTKRKENQLCMARTSLAAQCARIGIYADFRPLTGYCSKDSLCRSNGGFYKFDASGCQKSCDGTNVPKECPINPSEGCGCPESKVLHYSSCLPRSVCMCDAKDGDLKSLGVEWLSADCKNQHRCVKGPAINAIITEKEFSGCNENAYCDGKYGYGKCHCKVGFKGDGVNNCEKSVVTTSPAPTISSESCNNLLPSIDCTNIKDAGQCGKIYAQEVCMETCAPICGGVGPKLSPNLSSTSSPIPTCVDLLEGNVCKLWKAQRKCGFGLNRVLCRQTCASCNFKACTNMVSTATCEYFIGKKQCSNLLVVGMCRKECSDCYSAKPSPNILPQDDGDLYFKPKPFVFPKPNPKPLGMESGVITNEQIEVSSMFGNAYDKTKARPLSNSGWVAMPGDASVWLKIDIGSIVELHGIGILGNAKYPWWITSFKVQLSDNGREWRSLLDLEATSAHIFEGNTENNKWKRHCFHRYYGNFFKTRYIKLLIVGFNKKPSMRVELYGFRSTEDPVLKTMAHKDVWTKSGTGCRCYFDLSRTDCACCEPGACQCHSTYLHQCVQCGYGSNCGQLNIKPPNFQVDGWTKSFDGCVCIFNNTRSDCACCQSGGCPCEEEEHKNQCYTCGSPYQCGMRPNTFGDALPLVAPDSFNPQTVATEPTVIKATAASAKLFFLKKQ